MKDMRIHFEDRENQLDTELRRIEALPFDKRMREMRSVIELLGLGDRLNESLNTRAGTGTDGMRHFVLPGIHGGDGNTETIREAYGDWRAEYRTTPERALVRVGQGEMWTAESARNPYLYASMSKCSALIGATESSVVVSHVSYSELAELDATIRFMNEQGIALENIYAVASVGDYLKKQFRGGNPVANDVEAYTKRGIAEKNIIPFEWSSGKDATGRPIDHNLTTILVSRDGLLAWSNDLATERGGALWQSPRQERVGDYSQEVLVKFRN